MSSVGQGLSAIGDGLLQLQEIWRQRSKEKIDLVLQQAGGDWGQAAQIIQSNPKLQKAFRTIYGTDIDPNQITKSVEQRIKELKEDEMLRDKGAYQWSVESGMNPLASARMADPNTANVWGPLAYEDPRMTGEENRQAALIRRGIAPKIQQYISMIQNYQQSTGQIAPPEWYSEAGIPYPGQMQQAPPPQNQALEGAANLMQMNPMTAALGQSMGGGLEALTQGVRSVFGGGQPQELMPGSRAYENLMKSDIGKQKLDLTRRGQDIRRDLGEQENAIRQQQADSAAVRANAYARLADATINKYNAQTDRLGKLGTEADAAYEKMSDMDKRLFDQEFGVIERELQAALRERAAAYSEGTDADVARAVAEVEKYEGQIKNLIKTKRAGQRAPAQQQQQGQGVTVPNDFEILEQQRR